MDRLYKTDNLRLEPTQHEPVRLTLEKSVIFIKLNDSPSLYYIEKIKEVDNVYTFRKINGTCNLQHDSSHRDELSTLCFEKFSCSL